MSVQDDVDFTVLFDRLTLKILDFVTTGTFQTPNRKLIFTYDDATNVTYVKILDDNDLVDVSGEELYLTDVGGGSLLYNKENFVTFSDSSSSSSSSSSNG